VCFECGLQVSGGRFLWLRELLCLARIEELGDCWMKDFRGLAVWKRAHSLVLDIYRLTEPFPKTELFGLTSQIRRAAASIPTNIAEGCGRDGDAELGRFLNIAKGSSSEVEYLLQLGCDLNYINLEMGGRLIQQTVDVRKMLYGLQKSLGAKNNG
jgi:four helix bundle protein